MNTEATIVWVMLLIGGLLGVGSTICVYAAFRRLRTREFPVLNPSPQESLTDMAIMEMITTYRCIEKGRLDDAKSSLASFMATWAGMASIQQSTNPLRDQTLSLLRSESAEFPTLSSRIEEQIRQWQAKTPEQMIKDLESELRSTSVGNISAITTICRNTGKKNADLLTLGQET